MGTPNRDKKIIQALGVGVLEVNADLRVRAWDRQMTRWTGLKLTDARDRPLGDLFPRAPELDETLGKIRSAQANGRTLRLEAREGATLLPIPAPNGRHFPFQQQHLILSPLEDAGVLMILKDVTGLALWIHALRTGVEQFREDAEYARREADLDDLTGLLNRNAAARRVYHAREEVGGGTGVLLLDLDHFKLVNDTWGHPAGDKVLAEAASRLMRRVRRTDVVARYGGEEFLVVLPGVTLDAGAKVGRALLGALRERPVAIPTADGARLIQVTASAGFAWCAPEDSFSLPGMLAKADEALYQAKRTGRDRMMCAPSQE